MLGAQKWVIQRQTVYPSVVWGDILQDSSCEGRRDRSDWCKDDTDEGWSNKSCSSQHVDIDRALFLNNSRNNFRANREGNSRPTYKGAESRDRQRRDFWA